MTWTDNTPSQNEKVWDIITGDASGQYIAVSQFPGKIYLNVNFRPSPAPTAIPSMRPTTVVSSFRPSSDPDFIGIVNTYGPTTTTENSNLGLGLGLTFGLLLLFAICSYAFYWYYKSYRKNPNLRTYELQELCRLERDELRTEEIYDTGFNSYFNEDDGRNNPIHNNQ